VDLPEALLGGLESGREGRLNTPVASVMFSVIQHFANTCLTNIHDIRNRTCTVIRPKEQCGTSIMSRPR